MLLLTARPNIVKHALIGCDLKYLSVPVPIDGTKETLFLNKENHTAKFLYLIDFIGADLPKWILQRNRKI